MVQCIVRNESTKVQLEFENELTLIFLVSFQIRVLAN